MDAPLLTDDFKEFLRLLNASRVEYLLVGGYAWACTVTRVRLPTSRICRDPRAPPRTDIVLAA